MSESKRIEKLEKMHRVLQKQIAQLHHENNTLQTIAAEQGTVIIALLERMACDAKKNLQKKSLVRDGLRP